MAGEKVVEGEVWRVLVRSEARRRKRAVFWRAGRGVVGLVVGRKEASQVLLGGRALVVRWVEMAVARSGFMVGSGFSLVLEMVSGVSRSTESFLFVRWRLSYFGFTDSHGES